MWRLSRSRSKSRFFRKIKQNRYCDFWSKRDLIPILYHPRGTGNRCRSQNGFYNPASSITLSAEEFISSTPNSWAKNSKSHAWGTGNRRRKSENGFTPIIPSVEEFISQRIRSGRVQRSLYLQLRIMKQKIKIESNRINIKSFIIIKSKSNQEEKPQLSHH